jgi:calpain-15
LYSLEEEKEYPFEDVIHWRRAKDFMLPNPELNLREASIFYEDIEPNDIK